MDFEKATQLRAMFKNVNSLHPLLKETITAIDLVELFKQTKVKNWVDFQSRNRMMILFKSITFFTDFAILIFGAETGARPRSVIANYTFEPENEGILLKNLQFTYVFVPF